MGKQKCKLMHPRNVFKIQPDYTELAIKYKSFRDICKLELTGKVSINYKNENVLQELTKTLLQEYFKLHVDLAPGSLVPTVPLRLNYILWVEDLLSFSKLNTGVIHGIDIGCGSSCIYSLLAAKANDWHMTALEANNVNIAYARKNVQSNKLNHLIKICTQSDNNVIFKQMLEDKLKQNEDDKTDKVNFTFCLCNPPFYDLNKPVNVRNPGKRAPAHNFPTGSNDELSCEGGEVTFVKKIIAESLDLKCQVGIYTSMMGHKRSIVEIKNFLNQHQIENSCQTEFHQGNTTRWGIAWSFHATENFDLQKFITSES